MVLLWNYPEIWWRRKGFFPRLLLLSLVFSLVGALSIAMYDSRVRGEYERLMQIQSKAIEELSRLTSEVKNERSEVSKVSESEVLKEIERVKEELEGLQSVTSARSTGLLGTSVDEALAAIERAYPTSESAQIEF